MATDTLPPDPALTPPPGVGGGAHAATPPSLATSPATLAWLGAAYGAVMLLAFVPLLQQHAVNLWARPHYQFFPLALIGAAFLAWTYSRGAPAARSPGNSGVTLAGVTLVWALLALGEVFFSPMLAAIAFLVLLAVVIYAAGGAALCRTLLPAWAFLWITVPPPLGLDRRIVLALQTLTSHVSSGVLDTLRVHHLLDGNVVQISGRRLLVEEACSGVSSLVAILASALFLILWLRRPWPRALLLVASAIGWVLVSNVVRVVTIAYVFERWGIDLSIGRKHDLLGLGCFALAVLLIWSTDRLFLFLVPGSAKSSPAAAPVPRSAPPPRLPELQPLVRVASLPMAVAFGLLFLLHASVYGLTTQGPGDLLPDLDRLGRDTLAEDLAGWKQEGFAVEARAMDSAYGEHSKMWVYKLGQRTAAVSIDYPFMRFHVLDECYLNQGWAVDKHTPQRGEEGEHAPPFYVELRLHKAALRNGYVLYCEYTQGGTCLEHESGMLRTTLKRYEDAVGSWRQRFGNRTSTDQPQPGGPVYQFQVFVDGNSPLSAQEAQQVRRLFFEAVERLRTELKLGTVPSSNVH
jgi:exosortase